MFSFKFFLKSTTDSSKNWKRCNDIFSFPRFVVLKNLGSKQKSGSIGCDKLRAFFSTKLSWIRRSVCLNRSINRFGADDFAMDVMLIRFVDAACNSIFQGGVSWVNW